MTEILKSTHVLLKIGVDTCKMRKADEKLL